MSLNVDVSSGRWAPSCHGVAVLGCGRAGQIHIKNLLNSFRSRAHVLYIVDPSEESRNAVKRQCNLDESTQLLGYNDFQTVLDDKRVNCVIVASVTHTHEEITIRSLRAGKSVFCEKPLSSCVQGVKSCYQEAKNSGRHLHCSFNRRYDPVFDDVRGRVQLGDVGRLHRLSIVSRDCPKPSYDYLQISGNVLHDCVIHDVDLASWILGQQPVEVYAQGHAFDEKIAAMDDWDTVCITMKYSNNVIVTVDISRQACYGYHQTLQAFGDKGMIQSEMMNPSYASIHTQAGVSQLLVHTPHTFSFPQRYHESYVKSLDNFFNVIDGHGQLWVTPEDVVNNCIVVDALVESLRSKRAVTLKWDNVN